MLIDCIVKPDISGMVVFRATWNMGGDDGSIQTVKSNQATDSSTGKPLMLLQLRYIQEAMVKVTLSLRTFVSLSYQRNSKTPH